MHLLDTLDFPIYIYLIYIFLAILNCHQHLVVFMFGLGKFYAMVCEMIMSELSQWLSLQTVHKVSERTEHYKCCFCNGSSSCLFTRKSANIFVCSRCMWPINNVRVLTTPQERHCDHKCPVQDHGPKTGLSFLGPSHPLAASLLCLSLNGLCFSLSPWFALCMAWQSQVSLQLWCVLSREIYTKGKS